MSVHAISWVLQNSEERLGQRLVLIVLADHAAADGTKSFASVKTIAQEARMSERAVQYALRKLQENGSIRATGRHSSGTTIYEIPGVQNLHRGVQNPAETTSDFAPEPSLTVNKGRVQHLHPRAENDEVDEVTMARLERLTEVPGAWKFGETA